MSQNEVVLNNNDPESVYNWLSARITSPEFRNIIKDFIDENCSSFIDVDENTFEQGQLFNEFTQLIENLLNDVLEESQISQEKFLEAAQRGLSDKKYKKYYEQLISFSDYNYFKSLMCRRNYAIIKQIEEQYHLKKENLNNQTPQINQITNEPQNQTPKTQEQINDELFEKHLREQEENDLQQALKDSLLLEEQKKRMKKIEEEELQKAIYQSLEESKKKEKEKEKENEKKPEKKPVEFSVQKTEFDLKRVEPTPKENPQKFIDVSSNVNFQFSGIKKQEEPKKNAEIISASKGFDFQIESKNKDFGFSADNSDNPYARPQQKENKIVQKIENTHVQQDLIDDDENEKPKIEENKEKKQEKEIKNDVKKEPLPAPKSFDLLTFEDQKPENIEVANTINFNNNQKESASSIIKNAISQENNNVNKINEDDGGLLIDDDEEDNKKESINNNVSKQNPFIDKEKDIKLGKIKIGKEGNFLNMSNQFGNNSQNYQVGGIQKLENNITRSQNQGAVISDNNDEDFMNKLKEVEKEKEEKMKQYREELLKMKREKRENKAREVLNPEELAKLEQKKRLADALKAKRK